jgi:hypothetical protein
MAKANWLGRRGQFYSCRQYLVRESNYHFLTVRPIGCVTSSHAFLMLSHLAWHLYHKLCYLPLCALSDSHAATTRAILKLPIFRRRYPSDQQSVPFF